MNLNEFFHARFLQGLLSTPGGRAHLLNQIADAEATDEGAIFDRLLVYVEDRKLRQMIERHRADELRHAELFRGCLTRLGLAIEPPPPHLRLLDRLDALAGHVTAEPIRDDRDIMIAYVMLLVIEERALNQFAQFIPAWERVDPATAQVFREVARDEARHLRYCHAIARRYAPGEATFLANLRYFRTLEAQAFIENSRANLEHAFALGLHPAGSVERAIWRGIQGLATRSGLGARTQYADTNEAPLIEAVA